VSPALPFLMFLFQAEPAPAPAPPPVAEPAPAPARAPVIPPAEEPPPPPAWSLGLSMGAAYRLPPAAHDVPPALGIAFSTFAGRRYVTLGRLELGAMASFSYQRFMRTVPLTKMIAPGQEIPYDGVRVLSTGDFNLWQTVGTVVGRVRPWVGAGGGVSLAHFTSLEPKYLPGESRPVLFQVLGAVGFHLEVAPQTDGGLQLEYAHPFSSSFVTETGARYRVFGDRLAVRLEMQYRF
jgi:hypothetical protein